jgi:nucleoside-diphosphate-sugar epimerase
VDTETLQHVALLDKCRNFTKARELLAPGWLCETEAARRDLEFEAEVPLERGLAETAAWYREHGWI